MATDVMGDPEAHSRFEGEEPSIPQVGERAPSLRRECDNRPTDPGIIWHYGQ